MQPAPCGCRCSPPRRPSSSIAWLPPTGWAGRTSPACTLCSRRPRTRRPFDTFRRRDGATRSASARGPSWGFLPAERIDLRVSPLSLVVGHVRLADLTLTAPRVRIVRTGPVEFNFSDLLALIPPADPNKPKSRWTISIGRLALVDGAVLASDRAVSPARDWQIQGITVEAGGLTTRAAQQPGHLEVRARVNEAPLDANAGSVVLTPTALTMHLTLDRFDLTQLRQYLPPGLPASLESGTLGVALEIVVERGEDRLTRAVVSGDIRVEGVALAQPGRPAPFVKLPRLTIAIKEADLPAAPGARKPASISVDAGSLRLIPLSATARMVVDGFDLAALGPYWPPTLPALAQAGSLGVTVNAGVERGETGLSRAVASGGVRLDALTLVRRDQSTPFLT